MTFVSIGVEAWPESALTLGEVSLKCVESVWDPLRDLRKGLVPRLSGAVRMLLPEAFTVLCAWAGTFTGGVRVLEGKSFELCRALSSKAGRRRKGSLLC